MSDLGDDDYLSDPEPDIDEKDEIDKDNSLEKKTTINPTSKLKPDLDNAADSSDEELELSDDDFDIEESENEEELEEGQPDTASNNLINETENTISPINSDVESDDEDDLQKFDELNTKSYINIEHPECITSSSEEINALCNIKRANNIIVDPFHKTNPFLTKYEKTKILGLRTKQLNNGSKPTIPVPSGIIDSYLIAQLELKAKKIPVIIRRPLSNGTSEYWKLSDLEQIY
tara:strand:- start:3803 stop:4498 length:696 start_codon:yes stop_codon:yes gene_type:complete